MKRLKNLLLLLGMGMLSAAVYADYLPIYGGPTFDSSTGDTGLPAGSATGKFIGVLTYEKYVAGVDVGMRVVRLDTSGAVTELDTLGTDNTGYTTNKALSVTSAGTTLGYAQKYVGGVNRGLRAVRWDASDTAATELGNLGTDANGFTNTSADDVNDAGIVVGGANKYVAGINQGLHPVRWNAAGVPTELGVLPGQFVASAAAVNQSGAAAGLGYKIIPSIADGWRAVRWDASGTAATELGNLGTDASGYTESSATAINDAGTAVGYALKYVAGHYKYSAAVRWNASGTTATELGNLGVGSDGDFDVEVYAINNAGTAVGVSSSPHGLRAVRWDASGSAATELGNPALDSTGYAFDINDAGIAVGLLAGSDTAGGAMMWGPDGAAVDLTTLIDPASGWLYLDEAHHISNDNWISGEGTFDPDGPGGLDAYSRQFFIHVPEPSTFGLVALSLPGLTAFRSRRNIGRLCTLIACVVFSSLMADSASADVFNMPAGQTSLQFLAVGNLGNAPDPATGSQFGAVPYA